jgi:membrane protease YdiL (CAAX protease family)
MPQALPAFPSPGSPDRSSSAPVVALVAVGCVLLAGRAWVAPVSAGHRAALFVALFAAMLLGSLLVPVDRSPRRLHPAAALAVGGLAIGGAAVVAGPAAPFPAAAWTLPLSLLAAVAEEALFRRVAYAQLARRGPVVAVAGAAALFAVVHVPLYGLAALPVDLGAGLVFGWQRWATGSWTAPAATHGLANVVAVLAR